MDMDTIALLLSPAAILGLVTIAKDLGLPTKLAALASVLLSVALQLGVFYLPGEVAGIIATGIVGGLAACGLFDGFKLAGPQGIKGTTLTVLEPVDYGAKSTK